MALCKLSDVNGNLNEQNGDVEIHLGMEIF